MVLTLQQCLEYLRHSKQADIDFYTRKKDFLSKHVLPDYIRLKERYAYELADTFLYDCASAEIERIEKLIDVCDVALFFIGAKTIVDNTEEDVWNAINNMQTIQEVRAYIETLYTKKTKDA